MIKKINYGLALLVVLSITLIPAFRFSEGGTAIQLVDFLLPVIAGVVYIQRDQIKFRTFYKFLILFGIYILFTILWNGRFAEIRDYFEIYKLVKFGVIILFFSVIDLSNIYRGIIYPVFWGLVVFNLLHYFNIFNFNYIIEHYYNGGIHIQTFGLNSIGGEATRRMIGTIGNPNNNAILFLILAILLWPRKKQNILAQIHFFLALSMSFLCQSRTAFIALFIIILFYIVVGIVRKELNLLTRFSFLHLCLIVGAYLVSYSFSTNVIPAQPYISDVVMEQQGLDSNVRTETYINSIFNSDVYKSNSVQGRLIVWNKLWVMIKDKPVFGHAPYKEYFYDNKLYAESEYVLLTWRYGFLGLLLYFLLVFQLIYRSVKNIEVRFALPLTLVCLVFLITGLTNSPFAVKELMVLFAIVIGLFFNSLRDAEQQ